MTFVRLFKKHNDGKEMIYEDEFGEWLIIRRNKLLSTVFEIVADTVKSFHLKYHDVYFLSYNIHERIPALVESKIMAVFFASPTKETFISKFHGRTEGKAEIVKLDVDEIACCNKRFFFLDTELLIKKVEKSKRNIKLLLPPVGLSASEIPITLDYLISSFISKKCKASDGKIKNNQLLTLLTCFNLEYELNENIIKDKLTYLGTPSISIKRDPNLNRVEISVIINDLKYEKIIPLVWTKLA
ncbi:hypothetical protein HS7_17780 [Sulfolobales archaeon HS-7]|nr:hypothetical protein HS7_17780 [Sulfolobales archaeon HS-7]